MDGKSICIEKYVSDAIELQIVESGEESELKQWVPKHVMLNVHPCHRFEPDSKFKLKVYLQQYIREYSFGVFE